MIVAKVGGSLYDLPDLKNRIVNWASRLPPGPVLLVPGGGEAVDVVRRLGKTHQLSAEVCHWLALRMVAVNAHFLADLLGVPVTQSPVTRVTPASRTPVDTRPPTRPERQLHVLDAHAFCQADAGTDGVLEHSWRVTSDSIAARVAGQAQAPLTLLKSVDLPEGWSWDAAAAAGLVDEALPRVVKAGGVPVNWINLRDPTFGSNG